jgi:hypothetical protein
MTAAAKEYADDSEVISYEIAGWYPVWILVGWEHGKGRVINIFKNDSMERSCMLEGWINHPRNAAERSRLLASYDRRCQLATEYEKEDAYDHRIDEYLYERRLERLGYLEDR